MKIDFHAVELQRLEDGTIRITIVAELCDQDCGERVRYWNDETGGNAACGCTVEGPEACSEIMMFPTVHALIRDALVEVVADRKRRVDRDVGTALLSAKQRRLLEVYAYTKPQWLGPSGSAISSLLRALDHGTSPPPDDVASLREQVDKLSGFPNLKAAIRALLQEVSKGNG